MFLYFLPFSVFSLVLSCSFLHHSRGNLFFFLRWKTNMNGMVELPSTQRTSKPTTLIRFDRTCSSDSTRRQWFVTAQNEQHRSIFDRFYRLHDRKRKSNFFLLTFLFNSPLSRSRSVLRALKTFGCAPEE